MRVTFGLAFALLALCCASTWARDGYQNRPMVCNKEEIPDPAKLTRCRNWIANVQRPDQSGSCCGEGDAFIADRFRQDGDKYYAIITQEYPGGTYDDGDGGTISSLGVPIGTEILIPKEKINRAFSEGGNPSGHGIVFLYSNGEVLCYLGPTLS